MVGWWTRSRRRYPRNRPTTLANPANVLSKLARAYLSGSDGDGEFSSFADHMRTVVGRFADPARYDAILIDSRAGLHETTAAAVLGLGANVIFFGLDEPRLSPGMNFCLRISQHFLSPRIMTGAIGCSLFRQRHPMIA